MGNVRNWTAIIAVGCLLLFLPWSQAAAPKITIKAERMEHSLTENITNCYGASDPVQVNYGSWELKGQFASWDQKADQVLVKGQVTVVQKTEEPMILTCQQLKFWPGKERFEATGSVAIQRGELKAAAGSAQGERQQIVLTENPSLTRAAFSTNIFSSGDNNAAVVA